MEQQKLPWAFTRIAPILLAWNAVTGPAGGCGRRRTPMTARSPTTTSATRRVSVHLCSAAQWTAITGEVPPPTPVDRDAYVDAGLPWFDFYHGAQDLFPIGDLDAR